MKNELVLPDAPVRGVATLHTGDVAAVCAEIPACSVDAVLCDPPYHLTENSRKGSPRNVRRETPFGRHTLGTDRGFMGQTWDGGDVAFRPETWEAVQRVMKPGAYLMAFGGSRTFHRLAVALEDAGFILIDTLMWLYGTGFPKARDVAHDIDRKKGVLRRRVAPPYQPPGMAFPWNLRKAKNARAVNVFASPRNTARTLPESPEARQWDDYRTVLKPAFEPILLFRKPGEPSYADNVLQWGCGALNIGGCRIPVAERPETAPPTEGRYPANVILDPEAAALLDTQQAGIRKSGAMRQGTSRHRTTSYALGVMPGRATAQDIPASEGGASRFFYTAKVSTAERQAGMGEDINDHPTLKPQDLIRYLATLILPPSRADGTPRRLLVPFSGAGSEMIGALQAGWEDVQGIEQQPDYQSIAERRIRHAGFPVVQGNVGFPRK